MTKIIAVASAKGGVGKTTTSINIGTALARFGREVIVVDANLKTPDVGVHLGAPTVPNSVHDAVLGKKSIRNCVYSHPSGVKIAPASIALADLKKINPKNIGSEIKKLEGTCEIIIVDSPSGINDDMFSAVEVADEVLIVTTADLPAVTSALKTVALLEEKGITVVGVVLNRVRNDSLEMASADIETLLEKPVIASIPEDNSIREALVKNNPVVYSDPDAKSSIAYKELAALLIGQKYEVLTKKEVTR